MLLTSRVGPDGEPPGSGVYYDEWRRTAEGWRFAKRTLRHDFPGRPEPSRARRAGRVRWRAIA